LVCSRIWVARRWASSSSRSASRRRVLVELHRLVAGALLELGGTLTRARGLRGDLFACLLLDLLRRRLRSLQDRFDLLCGELGGS
jgi:hypothetical protein